MSGTDDHIDGTRRPFEDDVGKMGEFGAIPVHRRNIRRTRDEIAHQSGTNFGAVLPIEGFDGEGSEKAPTGNVVIQSPLPSFDT